MSPRQPRTPSQGKPEVGKDELEAKESKEAAATEDAPATERERTEAKARPKTKRRLRRSAPQAEGTAADVTGVEKDAAEAATEPAAKREAAGEPETPGEPGPDGEPEPEPGIAATMETEPAPKPRRTRRKAEPEAPPAPAEKPKRPAREPAAAPPMVRAHAKYVRTSARKARLVCDHIRGKSVEEARAILAHANRDVARDWSKLLESAVANAEHNHELIGDELRIHAVKADEGPTLKRFRPRAMGRATKIRKRTSHLSITLTPKDEER